MPGFDLSHLAVISVIAVLVLGPARLGRIRVWLTTKLAETQKGQGEFLRAFDEAVQGKSDDTAPAESEHPEESSGGILSKYYGDVVELRQRLIISVVSFVILTVVAYVFSDALLAILRAPAGDIKLRAFSPMDGFLVHFRIALYGGLFLSAPIWIYQITRYVTPGLFPHEKRFILPVIIAAVILFFLGNAFGYYMLQGMMNVIFIMFGTELEYFPSADPFISFVVFFLLATGIAFELPIIVLVFVRIGWLSHAILSRQRKVAYFIIFVFAELITPVSDPLIAPMVVMIPMTILFELALLIARFIGPKRAAAATQ